MRENPAPVIICERDLPDGEWKDVMDGLKLLARPPSVIVISRHADEDLWVAVLTLGGYDVLPKPLEEEETQRAVDSAWRPRGGGGREDQLKWASKA